MPQAGKPPLHASSHEDGGRDEISLASLSGTPAALTTHAADADAHHSEEIPWGRAIYNSTQALIIPGASLRDITAAAYTANRVYYFPIKVDTPITIDRLAIEVTIAAAAGSKARMGIYNADVNWQPTSLVVDGGEVALDATGVITATINVTLQEGRYLLAYTADAAPTLRIIYVSNNYMGFIPTLGSSPTIAHGWVSKTYAALADPGTAWDTAGTSTVGGIYWVLVRVATP